MQQTQLLSPPTDSDSDCSCHEPASKRPRNTARKIFGGSSDSESDFDVNSRQAPSNMAADLASLRSFIATEMNALSLAVQVFQEEQRAAHRSLLSTTERLQSDVAAVKLALESSHSESTVDVNGQSPLYSKLEEPWKAYCPPVLPSQSTLAMFAHGRTGRPPQSDSPPPLEPLIRSNAPGEIIANSPMPQTAYDAWLAANTLKDTVSKPTEPPTVYSWSPPATSAAHNLASSLIDAGSASSPSQSVNMAYLERKSISSVCSTPPIIPTSTFTPWYVEHPRSAVPTPEWVVRCNVFGDGQGGHGDDSLSAKDDERVDLPPVLRVPTPISPLHYTPVSHQSPAIWRGAYDDESSDSEESEAVSAEDAKTIPPTSPAPAASLSSRAPSPVYIRPASTTISDASSCRAVPVPMTGKRISLSYADNYLDARGSSGSVSTVPWYNRRASPSRKSSRQPSEAPSESYARGRSPTRSASPGRRSRSPSSAASPPSTEVHVYRLRARSYSPASASSRKASQSRSRSRSPHRNTDRDESQYRLDTPESYNESFKSPMQELPETYDLAADAASAASSSNLQSPVTAPYMPTPPPRIYGTPAASSPAYSPERISPLPPIFEYGLPPLDLRPIIPQTPEMPSVGSVFNYSLHGLEAFSTTKSELALSVPASPAPSNPPPRSVYVPTYGGIELDTSEPLVTVPRESPNRLGLGPQFSSHLSPDSLNIPSPGHSDVSARTYISPRPVISPVNSLGLCDDSTQEQTFTLAQDGDAGLRMQRLENLVEMLQGKVLDLTDELATIKSSSPLSPTGPVSFGRAGSSDHLSPPPPLFFASPQTASSQQHASPAQSQTATPAAVMTPATTSAQTSAPSTRLPYPELSAPSSPIIMPEIKVFEHSSEPAKSSPASWRARRSRASGVTTSPPVEVTYGGGMSFDEAFSAGESADVPKTVTPPPLMPRLFSNSDASPPPAPVLLNLEEPNTSSVVTFALPSPQTRSSRRSPSPVSPPKSPEVFPPLTEREKAWKARQKAMRRPSRDRMLEKFAANANFQCPPTRFPTQPLAPMYPSNSYPPTTTVFSVPGPMPTLSPEWPTSRLFEPPSYTPTQPIFSQPMPTSSRNPYAPPRFPSHTPHTTTKAAPIWNPYTASVKPRNSMPELDRPLPPFPLASNSPPSRPFFPHPSRPSHSKSTPALNLNRQRRWNGKTAQNSNAIRTGATPPISIQPPRSVGAGFGYSIPTPAVKGPRPYVPTYPQAYEPSPYAAFPPFSYGGTLA